LNDLKTPIGSSRDVHENLGDGSIGYGPLKKMVRAQNDGTSIILETPQDKPDNNRKKKDVGRIRKGSKLPWGLGPL